MSVSDGYWKIYASEDVNLENEMASCVNSDEVSLWLEEHTSHKSREKYILIQGSIETHHCRMLNPADDQIHVCCVNIIYLFSDLLGEFSSTTRRSKLDERSCVSACLYHQSFFLRINLILFFF